jgi:chromosome segregation ATPase
MPVRVTWTKLFAFAGTLLAGVYGVTAYVDVRAEARQAALSRLLEERVRADTAIRDEVAALRKELANAATQLDALAQQGARAEERSAGLDSRLEQLRTDLLAAIARGASVAPPP